MNIHKFYPLQEPQPEEFDEAFVDATFNLIKRFGTLVDIPVQGGIVPSAAMYALTQDPRWYAMSPGVQEFNITQSIGDNFAFDVGPGMAFSRNTVSSVGVPMDANNPTDLRAERIFISPADALVTYDSTAPDAVDVLGNPMPRPTGCKAIQVLPNHTYYVYVRYLQCVDATASALEVGNKYTINSQTGQLQYVHWIDGYQIKTYRDILSTDPDDVYIGTVITDGSSIISPITPDQPRKYLSIPGPLVTSRVSTELIPTAYPTGVTATPLSFTEHINSVADIGSATVANPHGTTIQAIPGLEERFGIFSAAPNLFYTNGVVDTNTATAFTRPGPFWATAATSGVGIAINPPVSGQSVAIAADLFDSTSTYCSQVYSGITADPWVYPPVTGSAHPYCDFSVPSARPTGYYFIYLENTPINGVAAAAVKAATFPFPSGTPYTGLLDMVENPGNYLLLATQFPVAIVYFNGTGFDPFTLDPWTRQVPTATCWALDLRRYGTISTTNISHDRRSYTNLESEVPQEGMLAANKIIYSDHIKWIAQGPAMVVTTYPVVQAMVKKAGRIRRVTVFSNTVPTGGALSIDITRNYLSNTIFSTYPSIPASCAANTHNYAGTIGAVIMDVTEAGPMGAPAGCAGTVSYVNNYVYAGDRLQLIIRSVGATVPGGDDLLVMIYIE